jgi:hypothetical protein
VDAGASGCGDPFGDSDRRQLVFRISWICFSTTFVERHDNKPPSMNFRA